MSSESSKIKLLLKKFQKIIFVFSVPRKCLKVHGAGKPQKENINSVNFNTKKNLKKEEIERGG